MGQLSELRANAKESNWTLEQLNSLRKEKAGRIFDILQMGWWSYEKEYDVKAIQILDKVKENCSGFVVDIAERFSSIDNHFPMSDKQKWCIAFAFIKIETEFTTL